MTVNTAVSRRSIEGGAGQNYTGRTVPVTGSSEIMQICKARAVNIDLEHRAIT